MEFPDLGKNCTESSCKRLDFLPMKCYACNRVFCSEHFHYTKHNCPEAYKKDNQVPVCPLCSAPIPVRKGEPPDLVVGQHIDNDCQSDPAKERRKRIYTNRCSKKGCKQKELIPVQCERCRNNYCLRHRHETDHECQGFQGTGRGVSQAGAAAMRRHPDPAPKAKSSKPQQSTLSSFGRDLDRQRQQRQQGPATGNSRQNAQALQGGMSEDEAMARALAMSMADSQPRPTGNQPSQDANRQQQEQADEELARALQLSEEEARRQGNRPQQRQQQSRDGDKSTCRLS